MKNTRVLMVGIVLGAALTLVVGQWAPLSAVASQDKGDIPMTEEQMKEMMAQWQKMNMPGDHHKHLSRMSGKWTTEMKSFVAGVGGADPTASAGKSESKMIMGDRFLLTKFKGEMMGQPFEGMAIDGYDNFKKKYVSIWLDSMGTAIYPMEGTCSADAKSYTYHGQWDDCLTGEKNKKVRAAIRWTSDDEYIMEMFETPKGSEETKVMEIKYTRAG